MPLKGNYELCVLLCSILGWNVWWKPASTLNKTPHWIWWLSNNRLDFWSTYLPPTSQMPSNLDFQVWNEYIYIVWVNMLVSCEPFVTAAQQPYPNQYKTSLGFIPPLGFESSHPFRTLSLCSDPVNWPLLGSSVAVTLTSPRSHVWALPSPGDSNTVACESVTSSGFQDSVSRLAQPSHDIKQD